MAILSIVFSVFFLLTSVVCTFVDFLFDLVELVGSGSLSSSCLRLLLDSVLTTVFFNVTLEGCFAFSVDLLTFLDFTAACLSLGILISAFYFDPFLYFFYC